MCLLQVTQRTSRTILQNPCNCQWIRSYICRRWEFRDMFAFFFFFLSIQILLVRWIKFCAFLFSIVRLYPLHPCTVHVARTVYTLGMSMSYEFVYFFFASLLTWRIRVDEAAVASAAIRYSRENYFMLIMTDVSMCRETNYAEKKTLNRVCACVRMRLIKTEWQRAATKREK